MFTDNPNPKLKECSLASSAGGIDTRSQASIACGNRAGCAGYRCFPQAKLGEPAADAPVVEKLGPQSAKAVRVAKLAALKQEFDPDELAKLDKHNIAHVLARAQYIDPNCQMIMDLFEQVKDEFWAPCAEQNLKSLRGQLSVKAKPARKRTRKIDEDPALRPNLFRDLEVPLPPSPPIAKVQKLVKRVVPEMTGDPTKLDPVPVASGIEQNVSAVSAAEQIHHG